MKITHREHRLWALLLRRAGLGPRGERISGNALALLAMQVGSRLLTLALTAQLARTVGVAGLGRYLLALTVQAIVLAVADLGLTTLATRELARPRPQAEEERFLGLVYSLKLATALMGTLLMAAAVGPLFGPARRWALAVAALSLPFEAHLTASVALMKGRQRMGISSLLQLGVRAVATFGGMGLIVLGGDEVAALGAYAVANLLGAAAAIQVLRRWGLRPCWRLPRDETRTTLSEAFPFAATGIASMLYRRIDLLLLSYWWGDVSSGLYGAAYRLWEAMSMVTASLLDALFPELARMAGDASLRPLLEGLYRRAQRVLLALSLSLTGAFFWAAPWLLALVYGRDVAGPEIAWLLRLLVLMLPLGAFYLLDGHLLYALGQQRRVTSAMVTVTLLNMAANGVAVWQWGMWGAVGVALLSETVLLLLLHQRACGALAALASATSAG
jgi:O-antigen/teichoic acid export membrane protein